MLTEADRLVMGLGCWIWTRHINSNGYGGDRDGDKEEPKP